MLLSDRFPDMTPEETERYLRHVGGYIVSYWHAELGCYVASRYCSIQYAMDLAGRPDDETLRADINRGLGNYGRATMTDGNGHQVEIYTRQPSYC